MKTARIRGAMLILAALCLTTLNVRASGPASTYAVLERVTFEPNEAAAERVQIWGAFSMVQGTALAPFLTSEPQRGSMYFRIPMSATDAQKQTIRKEWADLKAVAGTGQAVAFGNWFYFGDFSQALGNGRIIGQNVAGYDGLPEVKVRKDAEPRGEPTVYTTNSGVVKLPATGSHAAVVTELRALLRK